MKALFLIFYLVSKKTDDIKSKKQRKYEKK